MICIWNLHKNLIQWNVTNRNNSRNDRQLDKGLSQRVEIIVEMEKEWRKLCLAVNIKKKNFDTNSVTL